MNTITNTAEALISNTISPSGKCLISILAKDDSDIFSLAGALGAAKNVGLGAALAFNSIDNTINAYIDNSTSSTQSNLSVMAESGGLIQTISAGVAGAKDVSLAGSVSVNDVTDDVEAYVKNSDVTVQNGISLSAEGNAEIAAIAGTIAGAGKASVGAAVSTNNIGSSDDPNKIKAYIESSKVVSDTGSVSLSANSDSIIKNITGAGSGAGQFALGGSVSINNIYNEIEAYIKDSKGSKMITAQDDTSLSANDNSSISVIAGTIAGAGTAAAGAAVATANIGSSDDTNRVRAYIDDSEVASNDGGIILSALSDSIIFDITAGIGVAGTAGLQGSVSVNNVNNEVAAKATDSTLTAKDDITLTSRSAKKEQIEKGALQYESDDTLVGSFDGGNEDSDSGPRSLTSIQSLAGSISGGGTAGLGAAVATNNVANIFDSSISGSTVKSTQGDVKLLSSSEASIETISAALGAAGTFQAVGSVSLNNIDNEVSPMSLIAWSSPTTQQTQS